MKYLRDIWSGVLIILFAGFVISMVFGTSRSEVAQLIEASTVDNPMTF
jgi:hypothetical protein